MCRSRRASPGPIAAATPGPSSAPSSSPSLSAPSPPLVTTLVAFGLMRGRAGRPGGRRRGQLDGGDPGFLWRRRPCGDRPGRHLPPAARLARRQHRCPRFRRHRRSRSSPTKRQVGRRHGVAPELARHDPFQRLAFARPRQAVPFAAGEDRHQQMELLVAVAREGDRRQAARRRLDAELLVQLAHQRLFRASRRDRPCRRETPTGRPSTCRRAAGRSARGRRHRPAPPRRPARAAGRPAAAGPPGTPRRRQRAQER